MADLITTSKSYRDLLAHLKSQIRTAQVRAALAVNQELVLLYWGIGKEILTRQQAEGWGSKVIERLAEDLRLEFPEMKGLSPRNLKYMRAFAEAWPIVQQPVAQLPWGHNVRLLDFVKSAEERLWYAEQAIQNGWSRNVLVMQIESGLYQRQGKATTNFQATLPAPDSDLAQQLMKDPYNFDFLSLTAKAQERDLEQGLLAHLRQFLIELGVGFAFVGSQVPLEVGGEDFKLDLLFYHLKLRCFVVIDLKMGVFKPEYAGKMNFYLSAIDDMLRHPDDNASIGLVLCKAKNGILAEYAVRDIGKPLGVSVFKLFEKLPEQLKGTLPTIEEIEAELGKSGERNPREDKTPCEGAIKIAHESPAACAKTAPTDPAAMHSAHPTAPLPAGRGLPRKRRSLRLPRPRAPAAR
jgi:predicted nuclease of restriction endonuclease-like (RecB) superfamily